MNISDLNVDRNFILSSSQLIDVRYALRIMLMNLRNSQSNFLFVPSSEDGTRQSEIKVLEKLLNDIEYDKVKLANFIDNK